MDKVPADRLFPGATFAHAISLGGDCEPARSLRLHGRHTVHSLFDWLVTPLGSIAEILADDGARLGISFVAVQDGTSVRCGSYDVLYHHEFPRDGCRQVVFDTEAIFACRTKMQHKMASFLDLCEGASPVLFIRLGAGTTLSWDRLGPGGEQPRTSDLNALSAALTSRFPDLDYRVLVLTPSSAPPIAVDDPLDHRVQTLCVPEREDVERGLVGGWVLTDASWSQVLARINFSTTRCGDKPLEERLHWSGEADPPGAPPAGNDFGLWRETAVDTYLRSEELLRDALASFQLGGDAIRAVDRAKSVLRQAGLAPQIRQKAARLLSTCRRHGEALAALRHTAVAAPGLPEIALDIAIALEALGRPDEALAWVHREMAADPLRPAICKRLLRLEYVCGEVEAAFETLTFMLRHGLEPPSLAHEYGLRLWRRHRAHQAVRGHCQVKRTRGPCLPRIELFGSLGGCPAAASLLCFLENAMTAASDLEAAGAEPAPEHLP